jgi:ribosomal protein L37AE/L43A
MSKMGRHVLELQTKEIEKQYIMKRTDIPCPNCMTKKVIQETQDEAYCDGCGQRYDKQKDSNTLKFK